MSINSQSVMCTLSELDFTDPKHINILDEAIDAMFTGSSEDRRLAEKMLTSFKDDPASWAKVDKILEASINQQTKYFALQVLEQVITTRWKSLPRTECEGIKKYIVGLIIKNSMVSELMEREKIFLNKLNILLIHIVKREWPKRWESFIPDIVGSGKKNESLCLNNMIILRLLSEEVFDFSLGKMTQNKIRHLKSTLCGQFQMIFEFCTYVLENSQNAALVEVTLQTFLKFLSWIPVGFIFETKIIEVLIFKFFNVPLFRNVTLKCLTEISGLEVQNYDAVLTKLFIDTMTLLVQMLPLDTNIANSYNISSEQEQNFIQNLALFLSTFLTNHKEIVIDIKMQADYSRALRYLLLITPVEELEVFKICLEYWHSLFTDLYRDLMRNNFESCKKYNLPFYSDILKELRPILISRMVKPKEVLVVENENGEVVREVLTDTDSISIYKTMREALVYLANLDEGSMESVMIDSLELIAKGNNYSWQNLNTLCWAIGSISGALPEVTEKNFLVLVIRSLLTLCEERKGKDNKAIIASNIMYVVGQYPRFLRSHWKFLKTVVNKLFEFMHETHDGVQDMACDTFIKIATKCPVEFIYQQEDEVRPMICEIVECSCEIVGDLQPHQAQTFYEAVGIIIRHCVVPECKEELVTQLMRLPNVAWSEIIDKAAHDVDILKEQSVVKTLVILLKTNVRASKAIRQGYICQLNFIFMDMMKVYKVMSDNVNSAVTANGVTVIKQPLLKDMMSVKKEIIRLVASWLEFCEFNPAVQNQILIPFLEIVLIDYQLVPCPSVREVEVLVAMTTIVKSLHKFIIDKMPNIFDAVFECTLNMINKDMEEYPDFRTNFFLFIQAVNNYCFEAFLAIKPNQFKLVIDSIIWAVKHMMRDVAEIGLEILMQLLLHIEDFPEATQDFYKMYFTDILQHIFSVVTDTSQASGLQMHATILSHMFMVIENGAVSVPLSNGANIPADNITYIQEFIAGLLKSAYPHLTDHQIKVVVQGLFNLDENVIAFKEHLRDFLVQIREYTGEDDYDLFLEEREEQLRKVAEDKKRSRMNVPGIVGPYETMEVRSN